MNIVLAFNVFLARLYLCKERTYIEWLVLILSDRGRAIIPWSWDI